MKIYSWPERPLKDEYLIVFFVFISGIVFFIITYKNTFGSYIKLEHSKSYNLSVNEIEINKGFLFNDKYWIWFENSEDYDMVYEKISPPFTFFKEGNSYKGLFIKGNDTLKVNMSFGD